MSLLTRKMQQEMMDTRCAAALKDERLHAYVSKSFAAVPLLIESGHLATRKEAGEYIEMVTATAHAWVQTR